MKNVSSIHYLTQFTYLKKNCFRSFKFEEVFLNLKAYLSIREKLVNKPKDRSHLFKKKWSKKVNNKF